MPNSCAHILEEASVLAEAFIQARAQTNLTQEQVAERMGYPGRHCPAGERPSEALDAHAGAVRQGYRHPVTQRVQAGNGKDMMELAERSIRTGETGCTTTKRPLRIIS